jgi:undecaprenyl-diphosphatase
MMHLRLYFPQALDDRISRLVSTAWYRSPALDAFMMVVARWTPLVMVALISLAASGCALAASWRHSALVHGLHAILAAVLARVANEPITRAVARPRPFERLQMIPLVGHDRGGSFPSNHATGAFALAVSMAGVPGYGPILVVLAVLLTVSRVYVGLHYASDVVAGVLHGSLCALLLSNLRFSGW